VNSQDKAIAAAQAALEKKAYDLVVLQVGHLSSIADYFLIATGRSDVQVRAIARGIEERLHLEGERALSIEGTQHGHWAVLDFNDGSFSASDFGDRTRLHPLAAERFSAILAARVQPMVEEDRASR